MSTNAKPGTGLVEFNVSKSVRAKVEETAKSLCEERDVKYSDFNQNMNALSTYRCLKDAGCDFTKVGSKEKIVEVVLGILKVAGNASALKQAIAGEKKSATSVEVDTSLLD